MKEKALFFLFFMMAISTQSFARQPITCASDLDGSIMTLPHVLKIDRLVLFDEDHGSIGPASGNGPVRSPAREAAEIIRLVRTIQFYVVALPAEKVMLSDAAY